MATHKRAKDLKRAFRRAPPGAPPGTLAVVLASQPTHIRMIAFGPEGLVEGEGSADDLPRLLALADGYAVRWLDVVGVEDPRALELIGIAHDLHPLALEDVAHVHQRAKVEHFDDHDFVTVRMVQLDRVRGIDLEQFSLFIGDGWLLSFQERAGDAFDPVRARMRNARGRIRSCGADYLAYSLLDSIVDAAFPVLEHYDEWLDRVEARIVAGQGKGVVAELHRVRADLLALRRTFWPMREAMGALVRDESRFIGEETRVFFRDCHDHSVQLLDLVDSWRELGSSLMDLHLSSVGQRTNETMRLLTVISVLFMPLTFIAGLYGMNFDPAVSPWNMPELGWALGYPFALALMLFSAAAFLVFFHRNGFLQPADDAIVGATMPLLHRFEPSAPASAPPTTAAEAARAGVTGLATDDAGRLDVRP